MSGKLDGKIAVVTGGNSGIGEATVHSYAREGASVVIMARREEQGIVVRDNVRNIGGTAEFIKCDVSNPEDIKQSIKSTIEIFGRVDVLFNNAGVAGPGNFPNETFEDWSYILDVNLNGVFNMCSEVWPHMVSSGGGCIVNMSSGAATFGFSEYLKNTSGRVPPAAYSVAKAGVDALTRYAASMGGKVNIRVNGVRPGQILSPMTDRDGKGEHGLKKLFDVTQILKGAGFPEDVANAVLFLSCDDSRFVTGEIMNIDGGMPVKL
tara:strand:+ start:2009 stop:2800 length:792 start_codon:yes stop_codon:yes gene_type:complete